MSSHPTRLLDKAKDPQLSFSVGVQKWKVFKDVLKGVCERIDNRFIYEFNDQAFDLSNIEFEVNISTCNDQLESFIKDLRKLFTFQKYAELLAHAANAKLETVCNERDSNTLKKTAFDIRSSPILPYSMTASTTANWFSSS